MSTRSTRFRRVGVHTLTCRTCLSTWHEGETPRHFHDCDDVQDGEGRRLKCPDGGACHHACDKDDGTCWRVRTCAPLSNVFPNDEWPEDVKEAHRK